MVGRVPKKLLSRRWYDIVGSGLPAHLAAGTRIEKALNPDGYGAYMGAYVSKLEQKDTPAGFRDVGRFWGATRTIEKTVVEIPTVYAEASRVLRTERKANVGARRKISDEQKALAIEKFRDCEALFSEIKKIKVPVEEVAPAQIDFDGSSPSSEGLEKPSILVRFVTRGPRPRAAGIRQNLYDFEVGAAKLIYSRLDDDEKKLIRKARKAWSSYKGCSFRAVSYAKRWRWKGRGFVCLQGARHFKAGLARQAVLMDAGRGYTKFQSCFCDSCLSLDPVNGRMKSAMPLRREVHPDIWREFVPPPRRPLRVACILPAPDASASERDLCTFRVKVSCHCLSCRAAGPEKISYVPPALRGQMLFDKRLAPDYRPEDFGSGLDAFNSTPGVWG